MDHTFPFLFFSHGEVSADSVDKCEEVFVWFARPVTASERRYIVRNCPPPLAGSFSWGDCFAYFGSAGDSYDFELVSTYGSDAIKKRLAKFNAAIESGDYGEEFPDLYEALDGALPKFAAALDAWAKDVHARVPIVFLMGPNGTPPDDPWSVWSERHSVRALTAVQAWERANPWCAKGEDAGSALVEPAQEAEGAAELKGAKQVDAYLVQAEERGRVAECFGWIKDRVERMAFENADEETRRALTESIYAADQIDKPVERLTYDENRIQTNSGLVLQALGKKKSDERRAQLERFSPWTQLAYLASYDALKAKELFAYEEPARRISELVAALPPERAGAVTSVVTMIADNLVQNTPAFSKRDKKHAGLAAKVLSLVHARVDCPVEAFVNGGTYYEWAGDDEASLAVGLEGARRFPESEELVSNVLGVAGRLKRTLVTAQFAARRKALRKRPKEDTLLNETFALVQAQKVEQARKSIERYFDAGGKATPKVLVNYTYVLRESPPRGDEMERALDRVEEAMRGSDEHLVFSALVENAVSVLNEHGRAPQSIELAKLSVARGGAWTPALLWNTTHSAYVAKDHAAMRELMGVADSILKVAPRAYDASAGLFENLAELAALVGEPDRAFSYLERRAALPSTAKDKSRLETSEALAALRDDPRWATLVERFGAKKPPKTAAATPAKVAKTKPAAKMPAVEAKAKTKPAAKKPAPKTGAKVKAKKRAR